MGCIVSFLMMGNAGFISSTVPPQALGTSKLRVSRLGGSFVSSLALLFK